MSGRSAKTGNRGQDDPATAEVTAILLGYLVSREKISAQRIAGAQVIGSALWLIDGRMLKFFQAWTHKRVTKSEGLRALMKAR